MIREAIERAQWWLQKRHHYRAIFLDQSGLLTRSGQVVIKDLAKFCDAYRTTTKVTANGGIDSHASAVAAGRREVYLRLQAMLRLPDDEVLRAMEIEQ